MYVELGACLGAGCFPKPPSWVRPRLLALPRSPPSQNKADPAQDLDLAAIAAHVATRNNTAAPLGANRELITILINRPFSGFLVF